jgi:mannose-6-phosphate isomerase-like protein (cupin superfamily)
MASTPTPLPSPEAAPSFPARYSVAHLDEISPSACPCGWTRRAFMTPENTVASLHVVDITEEARPHYHKTLTEIYLVLEGEGVLEIDGDVVPLRPLTAVMIRPGCRHRAVGRLRIINIPIPKFDPADEWFD